MKDNFVNKKPSKGKIFLIFFLMIFVYLLNNSIVISFIGGQVFNFVVRPLLWGGIALLIWTFPKVRAKGKLIHRSYYNWYAFNFGILFVIISIGAGVVGGLGKSPYDHSITGIMINTLLVGSTLVGRESARSYLVNRLAKKENYLIFILISLFMTVTNISMNRFMDIDYTSNMELVKFLAETFAPEFSENMLATFLVYLGGPLTSIIYLGIIEGFHWLSPILPDLKWIIKALIGVMTPIFFLIFIQNGHMKLAKQLKQKDKGKENPISWILTSLTSIAIVWFAVGLFPIYPSVIVTGSMEPMVKPGDVILVKKIDGQDVGLNDVIQFRRDNILISHRIIGIVEDEKTKSISFRTKGDNNTGPDLELVKPEEVKGTIIKVVPKIGWPTLLLKQREKNDIPLEKVEF